MKILLSLTTSLVIKAHLDHSFDLAVDMLVGALGPVMLPRETAAEVVKSLVTSPSWPATTIGEEVYLEITI